MNLFYGSDILALSRLIGLGNGLRIQCVWALQIWAYEAIPAFGNKVACKTKEDSIPRCLKWLFQGNKHVDLSNFLKHERVPVTEKSGRIHTSVVSVVILPQADQVDVHIKNEDLKIDTYRSGVAGGQSVNTTDSAVRITHIPTGLIVAIQDERSQHQWATFLDAEGRVMDPKALSKRIFYEGIEHNLRKEVWRFLLGYHAYDSTFAEREYLMSVKKLEYETIKKQWQSISSEQAKRFTKFRERKGLIDKDVVRTDRSLSFYDGDDNPNVYLMRDILLTYSFYNFDLGYCQGMSDLLSPILYVMDDESESFWCFVYLLERLGPNFNRDQSGMHSQLFALSKLVELLDSPLHNYFKQNDCLNYFFCFRWLLIQFKREFEYDNTMRIWEVLWTHHLSEHLHLYMCVAILKRYRSKIIGEQMDFDTLLKFINELSGQLDLDSTLREAEALCICAGENGTACVPPGTPPSLPVEDASVYPQLDDEVL